MRRENIVLAAVVLGLAAGCSAPKGPPGLEGCLCGYGGTGFVDPDRRWNKTDLTWTLKNVPAGVSERNVRELLRIAFAKWAAVTPLRFTYIPPNSRVADIPLSYAERDHGDLVDFDGPGMMLAHANDPPLSLIHFDGEEPWAYDPPSSDRPDFLTVAIHEIGHALGLGHTRDSKALMYGPYLGPRYEFSDTDVNGIQQLYGSPIRAMASPDFR